MPPVLPPLFIGAAGQLLPHGYCYLWNPRLLWTHVIADGLIALSYAALSIALVVLYRRTRTTLPFGGSTMLAFGLFIVLCGVTHAMDVWTLWTPSYWTSAGFKVATAAVSVMTAVMFPFIIPRIVRTLGDANLSENRGRLLGAEEALSAQLREQKVELERQISAIRLLDAAIGQITEAIVVVNARNGREQAVIEYANRAFSQMAGLDHATIVGQPASDLTFLPPDMEPMRRDAYLGRQIDTEFRVAREGEGTRTIQWNVTPVLESDGKLSYLLSVFRDVTTERNLSDQLRQSQKMEAMGRLAGGVAHDFNNLLTAILGSTESLASDPELKKSSEVAEIQHAAERAASLTHQLLAFSRQQVLMATPIDLNAAVKRSVKMLRRVINDDIELVTECTKDAVVAKLDAGALDQVLMNLVVNAQDAMPSGGIISVGTERDDTRVRLTVADTGHGMSSETMSRIFDPFFTTKPVGRGTGLGLSTAYGIVDQLGGRIDVESSAGAGSRFTLSFPISTEPLVIVESSSGPHQRRPDERNSETLLLAEDDEAIRRLAKRALELSGYVVLTAADGADAIEVARRHGRPIDLLITDVLMPRIRGPEVASVLLAEKLVKRVMFMSGYLDSPASIAGIAGIATPSQLLNKPFTPKMLVETVRAALDAERPTEG
jgi:two-component system cell cycle sensor histidine kinase/response regulator CckA